MLAQRNKKQNLYRSTNQITYTAEYSTAYFSGISDQCVLIPWQTIQQWKLSWKLLTFFENVEYFQTFTQIWTDDTVPLKWIHRFCDNKSQPKQRRMSNWLKNSCSSRIWRKSSTSIHFDRLPAPKIALNPLNLHLWKLFNREKNYYKLSRLPIPPNDFSYMLHRFVTNCWKSYGFYALKRT